MYHRTRSASFWSVITGITEFLPFCFLKELVSQLKTGFLSKVYRMFLFKMVHISYSLRPDKRKGHCPHLALSRVLDKFYVQVCFVLSLTYIFRQTPQVFVSIQGLLIILDAAANKSLLNKNEALRTICVHSDLNQYIQHVLYFTLYRFLVQLCYFTAFKFTSYKLSCF